MDDNSSLVSALNYLKFCHGVGRGLEGPLRPLKTSKYPNKIFKNKIFNIFGLLNEYFFGVYKEKRPYLV